MTKQEKRSAKLAKIQAKAAKVQAKADKMQRQVSKQKTLESAIVFMSVLGIVALAMAAAFLDTSADE